MIGKVDTTVACLVLGMLVATGATAVPDPTRPASYEEIRAWRGDARGGSPDWRLESVLISDQRRVAVINGQSVAVGDRVDGAEVLSIESIRVTIRTRDRQLELSLRRQAEQTQIRQDASR